MQDAHPLTSPKLSTPIMETGQRQRQAGNKYATPTSTKKVDEGIWASLSKTAKSLFSEEEGGLLEAGAEVQADRQKPPVTKHLSETKPAFGLQKSLDAITNSLSFIGDKVGTAIEESLDVISTKAVDFIEGPPPSLHDELKRLPSVGPDGSPVTNQLKASRDVATAMVTKVRQYQRQVEAQRSQLDFATKRCSQLEEENKRLREGLEVQGKMDEDPLVRQQLEALLAEKARLARDNMQLQRENEHLFELLAYSTQGLDRSPSAGVEWEEEDRPKEGGGLKGVPEGVEISARGEGTDGSEADAPPLPSLDGNQDKPELSKPDDGPTGASEGQHRAGTTHSEPEEESDSDGLSESDRAHSLELRITGRLMHRDNNGYISD